MSTNKKIKLIEIAVIVIVAFILLVSYVSMVQWANSGIIVQSNYGTSYNFIGKVEIVNKEYWTLRVIDVGNTDLSENDIVELEHYLLITNRKYSSFLSKNPDRFIYPTNTAEEGTVLGSGPFIVTDLGLPKLEKGDSVVVSTSKNIDSSINERIIPLFLDKSI